ncbi:MAG: hypothetical protein GY874_01580 [Desulfobacteraceae bacterium]|nr:hypothetical protein [Desulfobacteraceae bacterium]
MATIRYDNIIHLYIKGTTIFLIYSFFLFPSLIFAGANNANSNNIGHNAARIKTIVNIPHYNGINIAHKINEKLIATYSKHDKKLKIWDRSKFWLITEYNISGSEVNQLFSIGEKLFMKSQSAFYKIDLATDSIERILNDSLLSSSTIVNDRFVVFADNRSRYLAKLMVYDHTKSRFRLIPHSTMRICGACTVEDLYYSNNNYYVFVDYGRVDWQVYDDDFKLINKDSISKDNITSDPNVAYISTTTKSLNDISKKRLVKFKQKVKSKIKKEISIETEKHTIKTEQIPGPGNIITHLKKFYLVNKQTGESRLLVSGEVEYATYGTSFTEKLIDTKNEVVAIKCRTWGFESFFIVDFSGNMLGETKAFHRDKIDIVPIQNYLFLINHTKGQIRSYDLKKQKKIKSNTTDKNKINIMFGNRYSTTRGKQKKGDTTDKNKPINMVVGAIHMKDFRVNGIFHKLMESYIFNDVFDTVDINISGTLLMISLADNTIKTWDLSTGKLLVTKYVLNENTEVIVTPEGYFSGKGNYQDYVHFVDNKYNVYSFSRFARRFYRPEIIQQRMLN